MTVEVKMPGLGRLNRALSRIGDVDHGEALERIGAVVESQTKERIARGKHSPAGTPWAKWSGSYAKTRKAGQSLLLGKGDLLTSIQYEVNNTGVVAVGSNLKYARTHQEGDSSRNIPARPFIGVSREDGVEVEKALESWYRSHVGPLFTGRVA